MPDHMRTRPLPPPEKKVPAGRRRLPALTAAAILAALGFAVPPASSGVAAPPLPAPSAVPGTVPPQLSGALDIGPVAGGPPVEVTLALPLRDRAGLEARVGALMSGRPGVEELTQAQVVAAHAPDPAAVAGVRAWAAGAGLEVVSVAANRTLVALRGTPERVGAAFGVGLHRYRAGELVYRAADRPAQLPAALAGRIEAVLGLSDLGGHKGMTPARPRTVTPAQPAVPFSSMHPPRGPADFWSFYHAPEANRGQGQTIAVLAAGELSIPQRDLVGFEQTYGLPRVPWTTVTMGPATGDTINNAEWDLDTQYATAFAPGASSLVVYDPPTLNDPDSVAELNRWVTDGRARQASFSAGECEDVAVRTGFETAADTVLLQAAAQGKTLFAPSGDTGSFCPKLVDLRDVGQATRPQATYPGASPYAVSVGGTTLVEGPGALREVAWVDGGGGMADHEAQPAHQAIAGGSLVSWHRGTPDVSLDADPDTGYSIIENGRRVIVGGTSAGAPAWLGIWARAQAARGGRLGFAAPLLYRLPPPVFNDVVVGFQGLWAATPGWDYTTGRGTPNIAALLDAVR
jgi:subtilase family serine protease